MAASEADKDYVHRVSNYLTDQGNDVNVYAYNYSTWEMMTNDRSESFDILDAYLDPGIDLITVQLSENVLDTSTFVADFEELLMHLMSSCPDARIIVLDDFSDDERSGLKKQACDDLNIEFISYEPIRGKKEYLAGLNTIVYGDDGEQHNIEHSGVAKHPGDLAFEWIADHIIERLQDTGE